MIEGIITGLGLLLFLSSLGFTEEKNLVDMTREKWAIFKGREPGEYLYMPNGGYEGKPAFVIIGLSPEYHGGWVQNIKIQKGERYKYSGWIKAEIEEGYAVCLYAEAYKHEEGKDISLTSFRAGTISETTDWIDFEYTFEPPKETDFIQIFPVLSRVKGEVMFSDVKLVVDKNLLSSSKLGWGVFKGKEPGIYVYEPRGGYKGRPAFVIIGKSSLYHGGWSQGIRVKGGKKYKYSSWIKAEIEEGYAVYLYADIYKREGEKDIFLKSFQAGTIRETTDWKYFEYTFETPKEANIITFFPILSYVKGRVMFSGARVEEIE